MKYAVIGGSLSGLACHTIEELKKRGFHIFALDIRNEEREENGITYIRTDLTKNEEIERAIDEIIKYDILNVYIKVSKTLNEPT